MQSYIFSRKQPNIITEHHNDQRSKTDIEHEEWKGRERGKEN